MKIIPNRTTFGSTKYNAPAMSRHTNPVNAGRIRPECGSIGDTDFRDQTAAKVTNARAISTPKSVMRTRKSALNKERIVMKMSENNHELRPIDLGKKPSELRARRCREDERNDGTKVV